MARNPVKIDHVISTVTVFVILATFNGVADAHRNERNVHEEVKG